MSASKVLLQFYGYVSQNFYLPRENNQAQMGKLEITVGPRQTKGRVGRFCSCVILSLLNFSISYKVENLQLSDPLPKIVLNCTVTTTHPKWCCCATLSCPVNNVSEYLFNTINHTLDIHSLDFIGSIHNESDFYFRSKDAPPGYVWRKVQAF